MSGKRSPGSQEGFKSLWAALTRHGLLRVVVRVSPSLRQPWWSTWRSFAPWREAAARRAADRLVPSAVARPGDDLFSYITGFVETTSLFAGMVRSKSADAIEFENGVVVQIRSSNYRRVRGATAIAIIIDEVAFLYDADSGWRIATSKFSRPCARRC